MKWGLWIVGVLFAAACSAPQPPDAWAVERVATDDDIDAVTDTLCTDVAELVLGGRADDPRLESTLDELAKIAALAGVADALPTMGQINETIGDETLSDHTRFVTLHDLMVDAAGSLDDATAAACEIPVFSGLYAATGFGDCHFEMEIPVASYTLKGEPGTCSSADRPTHLPCFSTEGDHLPTDCVSGEIVQAVGDAWREAGDPRPIAIDRVDPDAPPAPEVIRPLESADCVEVADLFTSAPTPNGAVPDFDRLSAAAFFLSFETADLVDEFIDASIDPPGLDEFERIVTDLDAATIAACGLPLASAWATITSPLPVPPCWTATGNAYPAYAIADCA